MSPFPLCFLWTCLPVIYSDPSPLPGRSLLSRLQTLPYNPVCATICEGLRFNFRAGAAITLALSGSQLTDIMEHIGWRHALTESHYLKVAQVHRPGGPSELLSRNISSARALVASYCDLNSLTNFTVAFTAGPSP